MKVIDINEKIYNIVKDDNLIIDILYDLGFKEIIKPGMINSVGRFMSLKSGAKLRKLDLDNIVKKLKEKGYEVINYE